MIDVVKSFDDMGRLVGWAAGWLSGSSVLLVALATALVHLYELPQWAQSNPWDASLLVLALLGYTCSYVCLALLYKLERRFSLRLWGISAVAACLPLVAIALYYRSGSAAFACGASEVIAIAVHVHAIRKVRANVDLVAPTIERLRAK